MDEKELTPEDDIRYFQKKLISYVIDRNWGVT